MPKIKLTVGRACVDENGKPFAQNVGEEIEVSAKEFKAMVEKGQGEPVKSTRSRKAKAPKGESAKG